jgi:biopolymer transport protein ExbB
MSLIDYFKEFALLGAEWVLWLLLVLSVMSVGVMFERWRFFIKHAYDPVAIGQKLVPLVRAGDLVGAERSLAETPGMEQAVLTEGLRAFHMGPAAIEEAMAGALAREKPLLEKHLAFLGTLGNNAPFIGLFGTVLGIIVAFQRLSETTKDSAKLVMQGISEALVATAVGILVAIPAVIAYNLLQRRAKRIVAHADSLCHVLLSEAKAERRRERG